MKRLIRKVAVLGSGVMGSRIACHFANIDVQVLLLDIPAPDADKPAARNRIVDEALKAAVKSSPAPLYLPSFASRIKTGNFEDDLSRLADCDWIIEVVVERLDIKQQLLRKVDAVRRPGSLITTNTSGIPIHLIAAGLSDDFRAHFCGTHFFNPPRYLPLLEIIPGPDTHSEVTDFLMDYGNRFLGKTTVRAKDTPAFIANRIGVYSLMHLFHYIEAHPLPVDLVDKLTGTLIGRPKSGTFRTTDVVGLDTLVHVAKGLAGVVGTEEERQVFRLPAFVERMVQEGWLGSKSGQGFFRKVKTGAKPVIESLDLQSMEYGPAKKQSFPALEAARAVDRVEDRLRLLVQSKDAIGDFYRDHLFSLLQYSSHRIPEIADAPYQIDDAMRAGFGWSHGPFELWDLLGFDAVKQGIEQAGFTLPGWIGALAKQESPVFYKTENGIRLYFDPLSETYLPVPGQQDALSLQALRGTSVIWKNSGTTITDLGDGILNLEFHTKMNAIGGEVIEGLNKALDLAEASYKGLVIYNEGENFSAGANVGMIFLMAVEQEYEELDFAIRAFQNAMMRVRYSSVPVVVAPHSLTLGGACEMSLHADCVVAHAETYMGLVEFGVGLIPGGGGTKEFALRLSDELQAGDIELNQFRNRFLTIGQAKVSTSAEEAFELGYLRKGIDRIVMSRSRQLLEAKEQCLLLSESGYSAPVRRNDVRVLGKQSLGLAYVGANTMFSGHYISEHDVRISQKLAWVLSGGDLSEPQPVSEQYLLDLEREAFLSLATERKTLERLQSILNGGKVLRN